MPRGWIYDDFSIESFVQWQKRPLSRVHILLPTLGDIHCHLVE
jgi:hypothetical protein